MEDLQQRLTAIEVTTQALSHEKQVTARRLAATEQRLARAERRLRATWTCAFIGTIGAAVLGSNPQARAQFGVTLTSLNNRLMVVEAKTAPLSVSGTNFLITGKNVQIVDGTGSTSSTSGLGNLTVGYNALRGNGDDLRTGSHNLIVGDRNNYASFGGMVVGNFNTITGQYASVSGGRDSTAEGESTSVSGGSGNFAKGYAASVSGGNLNAATGLIASVSGGFDNRATGPLSSVSGGRSNTASGGHSSVSGGAFNSASGPSDSVSGGQQNTASGGAASVSGGFNRSVFGLFDWRAGALFQDF